MRKIVRNVPIYYKDQEKILRYFVNSMHVLYYVGTRTIRLGLGEKAKKVTNLLLSFQ